MFNKRYLLIIFIIIFLIVAYLLLSNNSSFYNKNDTSTSVGTDIGSFSMVLGNPNDLKDTGIVVISNNNDKININIRLVGFSDKKVLNASIHKNTCKDLGSVAFKLKDVKNNQSITDIDIDLNDLRDSYPLSLVIKDTSTNNVFACSEITK